LLLFVLLLSLFLQVHNEAALVECDPALIPTMGVRSFVLGTAAGTIALNNGSGGGARECLALRPSQGKDSTARGRPAGDSILSIGDCSGAASKWSLTPEKTLVHSSGVCAAYSMANWSVSVHPADCAQASADGSLGTTWSHDASSGVLQALDWSPPKGSVIQKVPQAVPHCLLAVKQNVNISLGAAALLLDGAAKPVRAVGGASTGAEPFASFASFKLSAGADYVLAVSIETTRRSDVALAAGALATALGQARGADAAVVAAANKAWWERWWEEGAVVELGPQRQLLESFWYVLVLLLWILRLPLLLLLLLVLIALRAGTGSSTCWAQ